MNTALYRTLWRWHFYAGLFVIPFILMLAMTGAVYLWKPQLDRWEERAWRDLPTAGAVTANEQADAALAAHPGARVVLYRIPQAPGDAAVVTLQQGAGRAKIDVYVSPDGRVLDSINPQDRISALMVRIHGTLLVGERGSWIVELAASWAIVLVLTGLYLWWPRGRGVAGVLYPRIGRGGRVMWRDLHAVTGFWVSGFALVLLLSGLPWSNVWGNGLRMVRAEMGWVKGPPQWETGTEKGDHAQHGGPPAKGEGQEAYAPASVSLARIVEQAKTLALPAPVVVVPPGAPGQFGAPPQMAWIVRSDTQDRPARITVTYDMATAAEIKRTGIDDLHPIDQVVSYGIAWHEGQLFGLANQIIGTLTAFALMLMAGSGAWMWWRRKPEGRLGAPPMPSDTARLKGVVVIIFALAAVLPMLALSLLFVLLVDRVIMPRIPAFARWAGQAA